MRSRYSHVWALVATVVFWADPAPLFAEELAELGTPYRASADGGPDDVTQQATPEVGVTGTTEQTQYDHGDPSAAE